MAADSNAELMTDYLDDTLEAGDAESFQKFLDATPDARREVEDLQKLLSVVRELPDGRTATESCRTEGRRGSSLFNTGYTGLSTI